MPSKKQTIVNPVRKSSTFQRGGSFTPLEKVSIRASGALNPVFALKGIISSPRKRPKVLRGSSPLQAPIEAKLHTGQAAELSNGVKGGYDNRPERILANKNDQVVEKTSTKDQPSEGVFSIPSWGVSFAGAFSSFFFSLSFTVTTGDARSSLARSLLFSLLRFLLLASSRSFSRLGIMNSSFSNSDFGMRSAELMKEMIFKFLFRIPQSAIRNLLCTLGQPTESADFLHRSMSQGNSIGLPLCKESSANTYFHLPSPSRPLSISNAYRNKRKGISQLRLES